MSNNPVELKVPSVGESVTEVEIGHWLKQPGDSVRQDETVVILETDKATVEIPAPVSGRLTEALRQKGDRVQVGDLLGRIDPAETGPPSSADSSPAPSKSLSTATKPFSSPSPPHQPPTAQTQSQRRVMPAAARAMPTSTQ